MTMRIFDDWLVQINTQMKKANRKIILFLDNASSHSHSELSNITLQFFPPNMTSVLQPLDQGIIQAVKLKYRKKQMEHWILKIDECKTLVNLARADKEWEIIIL